MDNLTGTSITPFAYYYYTSSFFFFFLIDLAKFYKPANFEVCKPNISGVLLVSCKNYPPPSPPSPNIHQIPHPHTILPMDNDASIASRVKIP